MDPDFRSVIRHVSETGRYADTSTDSVARRRLHERDKARRAHVGPGSLDVIQACLAGVRAVADRPPGRNIHKGRPQRALTLVVDQHQVVAIFVLERIGHHSTPRPLDSNPAPRLWISLIAELSIRFKPATYARGPELGGGQSQRASHGVRSFRADSSRAGWPHNRLS